MSMLTSEIALPKGQELQNILQLEQAANLEDLFAKALTNPIRHILDRPSKSFRSKLVELGFEIAANHVGQDLSSMHETVATSAKALELLHAGSLVIDDIQDGSTERRGAPSLHTVYGVPLALNAGNWLYFLPFRLIDSLGVPDVRKQALSRACQDTLLRAHYGQALDIGVLADTVAQERVFEISSAVIELKTGALASLAFRMGAILLDGDAPLIRALDQFGKKYGVALQMFDDIGNVRCKRNVRKWAEDIRLKRLTFIASVAARELSPPLYSEFILKTTQSPTSCEEARDYLEKTGLLARAYEQASDYLERAVQEFETAGVCDESVKLKVRGLQHPLTQAYV